MNVNNFEKNEYGGWTIPHGSEVPQGTEVPAHSTLGNDCTLGNYCTLGDRCKLGDDCTLGNGCTLGDRCALGDRCSWLGLKVRRFMTAANIDGSGRRVKIVLGTCATVRVEAGCFVGSADEFCAKAESEGKHTYARVVRAIAGAIKEDE